jgi:c-di-GMP-binding flagellar brake protein YcgR
VPLCDKCGREVKKLTEHVQTKEKLCLKCITKSGFFCPAEELPSDLNDDRRGSIRIPITIAMSFALFDEDKYTEIKYPAFTVDISTAGICFAWDSCTVCRGYIPNSVDEQCIFYPYYIKNEKRRDLKLEFKITKSYIMGIEACSVYTLKEDELGLEYIGAQFTNVTPKQRRMLEKIIIKYGGSQ